MATRRATEPLRFENVIEDVRQPGIFSGYWQRALSGFQRSLNALIGSRNTGTTGAVASGTLINHDLQLFGQPIFITLTPLDGVPTNYFADQISDSTFRVNFTGGGAHNFGWSAET